MKDYYSILGVAPDASADEVRAAYLLRAQLLHPDRHADAPPAVREVAGQAMADLDQAWATLGDDQRRSDYDRQRQAPTGDDTSGSEPAPFPSQLVDALGDAIDAAVASDPALANLTAAGPLHTQVCNELLHTAHSVRDDARVVGIAPHEMADACLLIGLRPTLATLQVTREQRHADLVSIALHGVGDHLRRALSTTACDLADVVARHRFGSDGRPTGQPSSGDFDSTRSPDALLPDFNPALAWIVVAILIAAVHATQGCLTSYAARARSRLPCRPSYVLGDPLSRAGSARVAPTCSPRWKPASRSWRTTPTGCPRRGAVGERRHQEVTTCGI